MPNLKILDKRKTRDVPIFNDDIKKIFQDLSNNLEDLNFYLQILEIILEDHSTQYKQIKELKEAFLRIKTREDVEKVAEVQNVYENTKWGVLNYYLITPLFKIYEYTQNMIDKDKKLKRSIAYFSSISSCIFEMKKKIWEAKTKVLMSKTRKLFEKNKEDTIKLIEKYFELLKTKILSSDNQVFSNNLCNVLSEEILEKETEEWVILTNSLKLDLQNMEPEAEIEVEEKKPPYNDIANLINIPLYQDIEAFGNPDDEKEKINTINKTYGEEGNSNKELVEDEKNGSANTINTLAETDLAKNKQEKRSEDDCPIKKALLELI